MSGKSLSRLLLSFLPESVSGAPQYVEDTRGVQSADFVCLLRQTCDQKYSFFSLLAQNLCCWRCQVLSACCDLTLQQSKMKMLDLKLRFKDKSETFLLF